MTEATREGAWVAVVRQRSPGYASRLADDRAGLRKRPPSAKARYAEYRAAKSAETKREDR
ncbi:hypothetical protein GCM10022419_001610 [Nonomuraea rosea]|uniref:Uncharacterized protein n=1 Tax=Nonomuraea rosea TaxID=638574 RepID=A0ABP6V3Z8_9ACTN